jgi:hypothetical protein
MPPQKLIRRVDTMRYLLVWLFGGVYLDADNQRWGGDLHGPVFGRAPRQAATVRERGGGGARVAAIER